MGLDTNITARHPEQEAYLYLQHYRKNYEVSELLFGEKWKSPEVREDCWVDTQLTAEQIEEWSNWDYDTQFAWFSDVSPSWLSNARTLLALGWTIHANANW